jgi:hypothetical protein
VNGHGARPGAHRSSAASRPAWASLTYLADPADPLLGALLEVMSPDHVVAAIRAGSIPFGVARDLSTGQATRAASALAAGRSGCLPFRRTPC